MSLGNGVSAQNWLNYDYSYSGYASVYDDGLRIDISTDCGSTWDSIYGAIGPDLQTVPYEGSAWSPTCGSWASDSINLSNWGLNGDTIMVRFVAYNDYGNHFYLDNVYINGQNIIIGLDDENIDFHTSIYPNPTKDLLFIRTNAKKLEVEISNLIGEVIVTTTISNGLQKINLANQAKGVYLVKLKNDQRSEQRKIIIQ